MTTTIDRRTLMLSAGALAAAGGEAAPAFAEAEVAHSKGSEPPKLKLPANAIDCHMHFYHSRYPMVANVIRRSADATVPQYRELQKRLGMSRVVVVTPSAYGTDNAATLDGMAAFGEKARGVAVVDTSVTDAELKRLHGLGIRGVRFNLATPGTTTVEMIEPVAKRIAEHGWHMQFHMKGDQIAELDALWNRLPVDVVFDHLGRLPQPAGIAHPAHKVIRALQDKGRGWVKLSGLYMETKSGAPGYADTAAVAKSYIDGARERVVWGSDWPHPTESAEHKPDDAVLLDALGALLPTPALQQQVFVTNAEKLYDFPKA